MKIEVSIPEVVSLFKEIQTQPEQLFDIIRTDIRQSVGHDLSEMMQVELTQFLGRAPYEQAMPNRIIGMVRIPASLPSRGLVPLTSRCPEIAEATFRLR